MYWIGLALTAHAVAAVLCMLRHVELERCLLLSVAATGALLMLQLPLMVHLSWKHARWAFQQVGRLEGLSFRQIGLRAILRTPWVLYPAASGMCDMSSGEAKEFLRQMGQVFAGQVTAISLTVVEMAFLWIRAVQA
jgi:hypothetical protein